MNNTVDTKNYLDRFDEILDNMSMQMLGAKVTNSITLNFILTMVPHHQAAIYMSENLLKYTNYMTLENIAKNIIKMQTRGIEQMKNIFRTTNYLSNVTNDVKSYETAFFAIANNMIYKMKNSSRGENINLDFVSEMIPHHEGAVEMCNNLLKYRIDPRLREVAQNIIKEQSKGIDELQNVRLKIVGGSHKFYNSF